jgi:hypothetical protein
MCVFITAVGVKGDVFSFSFFRKPVFFFEEKNLVYVNVFTVQRGGVRSQRSHDHVHVFSNHGFSGQGEMAKFDEKHYLRNHSE